LTIPADKVLTIGEDVIVIAADAVLRPAAGTADTGNQPIA
jgi:hypothetical protein